MKMSSTSRFIHNIGHGTGMEATHVASTLSIDILVGQELRVVNQECKNIIYKYISPSSWCAVSRILKLLRGKKMLVLE